MKWNKLKTISKITIVVVVAAGAGIALSGVGFVTGYPTHDSDYCGTCHADIHESWLNSHGHLPEDASCSECHAEPMVWKDKQFTSDREFLISKCLECHPDIPTQKEPEHKRIRITHEQHLNGLKSGKMDCLDCHRELAHSFRENATNRPSMQGCYTSGCHPIKGETCKTCHYTEMTFGASGDTASCEGLKTGIMDMPPEYIDSEKFR